MAILEEFANITRTGEPLGPLTILRIGGPAEYLVEPRNRDELADVIRGCYAEGVPMRVLGSGVNLLIRDEGVTGVVVRLSGPEFTTISVEGNHVRAGGGAALSALISAASRDNLAGIETLVGILGTVGGGLRTNASDGSTSIGQYVRSVDVMDESGEIRTRHRDEIRFGERTSDLDDPVILSVDLELELDSADDIVKRMRKAWIQRKARQPFSYQHAVRAFKDPAGGAAAELIEEAGLGRTRVGGAEVSERNANYVIANSGASARDVLRLLELLQTQVHDRTGLQLEREVIVW